MSAACDLLLPALYRRGQLFWNPTVNKMTAVALRKLLVRDDHDDRCRYDDVE